MLECPPRAASIRLQSTYAWGERSRHSDACASAESRRFGMKEVRKGTSTQSTKSNRDWRLRAGLNETCCADDLSCCQCNEDRPAATCKKSADCAASWSERTVAE